MLKTLTISNFTAFSKASFTFSPGLNVIVGTNGTGKTHVLKLGYMLTRALPDFLQTRLPLVEKRAEPYFEGKLMGLFRPEHLNHLCRTASTGRTTIAAEVLGFPAGLMLESHEVGWSQRYKTHTLPWEIAIDSDASSDAALRALHLPTDQAGMTILPFPLFVPTKEIVSFFDGLIALFETYKVQLDETYRDLAVAMTVPELQKPSELLPQLLDSLSRIVGGELVLDKGKLLLAQTDGGRMEPQLMAEGFRKLGMLFYLVRRNVIQPGSTLFWDEPEANLNPDLMRPLIDVLVGLAAQGVQVILATHSLFVMREIEILMGDPRFTGLNTRFIALAPHEDGVRVSSGDRPEEVDPIAALDADLEQSGRYMETE